MRRKKTATAENTEKRELALNKWWVRHTHGRWIEAHPTATLGDLLGFVQAAEEELLGYDPDDVLAEIVGELDQAAAYLDDFPNLDEPVCDGGELPTVEYRMADLEQEIADVEELIAVLGETYRVSRLPKRLPRT
jgi:hypothetical protein